jgi:hypothetical protein
LFNSISAGDTPEYVRSVAPNASWCLATLVMSRNYWGGVFTTRHPMQRDD